MIEGTLGLILVLYTLYTIIKSILRLRRKNGDTH